MVSKSGISHDIFDGGDGRFPESKWSVMASKLVRYGLKTGLIWIHGLPYRTTLKIRSQHRLLLFWETYPIKSDFHYNYFISPRAK